METTAADGKQYSTRLYNLDAVIAVGYRNIGNLRDVEDVLGNFNKMPLTPIIAKTAIKFLTSHAGL